MKQQNVLERVIDSGRLYAAWQQVMSNAGAAGIDHMTVEEFAAREQELLALIHDKLKSGSYRFKPARRVLVDPLSNPRFTGKFRRGYFTGGRLLAVA